MKTKITKLITITLLACIGWSTYSNAQAPVLLKTGAGNSIVSNSLVIGNTLFFKITSGSIEELWKTDGTVAGTVLVKGGFAGILNMVNISGTLYFVGYASSTSRALWKSDGTLAGTILVKDFPGTYAQVRGFTFINNTCYFGYQSSSAPFAIWKTDGTDAGTVLVKPGVEVYAGSTGNLFYQAGNQIVFLANSAGAVSYRALWKTDGTAAGTSIIKDSILSPNAGNVLGEYLSVGTLGFFTVSSGASYNLWRTDGTTTGTLIVGAIGGAPLLTNFNGVLYFKSFANYANILCKSDGTVAGTIAVSGVNNIGSGLSSMGNSLYLGGKNSYDWEPYKSDGTAAGTALLKDITVGTTGSSPMYFTKVNTTMVFVANDGTNGNQIWKTDGTPSGTVMAYAVADTLSSNEAPVARIALNNYFLFVHGGATGDLYSLLVSSGSAGINTSEQTKNIVTVFPNPSNGIFQIVSKELQLTNVEIYNVLGEKVYSSTKANTSKTIIDISNQPKGIYFVKIQEGTNTYTKKIVVE